MRDAGASGRHSHAGALERGNFLNILKIRFELHNS